VTTVKRSIHEIDLTRVDWAKADQTTDDEIAAQIASDPDSAPDMAGQHARARIVRPPAQVDVKAIRTRLGLTQEAFARRYGFNRRTLQDWEQRRRRPEGPARLPLQIIDRAPEVMEQILVEPA
jgi:putative transcriptional regulator